MPNLEEEKDDEDALDHQYCLVCCGPTLHTSRGITPCNHDSICASCHIRLRSLLGDKRCPVCKATNETIIVDVDPDETVDEHKLFDQYERWGNDLGPNFLYRDDVQMFFPVTYYYQKVVPLFSLQCYVINCNYGKSDGDENTSTLKGLNHHLAAAHSMSLCQLCVDNKRNFISRLPRFTPHQLKEHNKYGDLLDRKQSKTISSDTKGHPLCQFCAPKRFYDLTALHEHLNKEHYKCHVCEKNGIHNQFFRDYNKLNMHFDKEHYLCHHPNCLAARFVVFSNDIDLIAHDRDIHGIINANGSTKINIEFNYRPAGRDGGFIIDQNVPDLAEDFNYGVNGEVFVPDSLDDSQHGQQVNEPDITHGPHAERTALLRDQARQMREEQGLGANEEEGKTNTEAFPALGGASNSNLVRWSTNGSASASLRGRNNTSLTTENFPSLGGGPKPKSNVSSKLRVVRKTTARPISGSSNFASSLSAVSRSVASAPSYYSSNVSTMNSTANLASANFPSLGGGGGGGSGSSRTATSTNKYADAQAYAKKNLLSANFPSLGSSSSGSNLTSLSSAKKKPSVFGAKKPPALDNILAFPSPVASSSSSSANSDGKQQIEKAKKVLGPVKYKELKKFTKSFALSELNPESYVSSAVGLFDKGIEDKNFWEIVPNLIASCPNESNSKRATRYLNSMRYPVMQSQSTASTSSYAASSRSSSGGGGGWSDHVNSIQNSSQRSQAKKKDIWGGAKSNTVSKLGSKVIAAAAAQPKKGTATKFMAKEIADQKKKNQVQSEAKQGVTAKKKKASAKKNELRDLAFGKF